MYDVKITGDSVKIICRESGRVAMASYINNNDTGPAIATIGYPNGNWICLPMRWKVNRSSSNVPSTDAPKRESTDVPKRESTDALAAARQRAHADLQAMSDKYFNSKSVTGIYQDPFIDSVRYEVSMTSRGLVARNMYNDSEKIHVVYSPEARELNGCGLCLPIRWRV